MLWVSRLVWGVLFFLLFISLLFSDLCVFNALLTRLGESFCENTALCRSVSPSLSLSFLRALSHESMANLLYLMILRTILLFLTMSNNALITLWRLALIFECQSSTFFLSSSRNRWMKKGFKWFWSVYSFWFVCVNRWRLLLFLCFRTTVEIMQHLTLKALSRHTLQILYSHLLKNKNRTSICFKFSLLTGFNDA